LRDNEELPTIPAQRGYAICTSPRSGSNLLCQYLASTGRLGKPLEYFNAAGRRVHDHPDFPDDPARQIECILTLGATANGIYGLKLFPAQFDTVAKSIPWARMLPGLEFVLLERRDVLGQAISVVRAAQTRQWRSTMIPQGTPVYDGAAIRNSLHAAARDYARWQVFFARNGIDPTIMLCEDLVADPQRAVDQVAALFGLSGQTPIDPGRINLVIQRDALNEAWKQRFRSEERDTSKLDLI
jgi:trehalose 2-sulfotransferase